MMPALTSRRLWAAIFVGLIQNNKELRIMLLEPAGTEEKISRIQNMISDFGQFGVPLLWTGGRSKHK